MQPGNTIVELSFLQGYDLEGNDVFLSRRFQNIKSTATDERVFTSVRAIANLSDFPLRRAIRRNDYDLLQLENME
ncbi:DUF1659 domain-containing protein [Geomicrobium sp. JCM 19038]|uniref:DUF1659 domain-containing protein n=1 Tax=Geomicrobium sp. JCM 19038 TaxID=1460635 RepID=UPI00045F2B1B|nr:DUF1659 domain-containing protein [Geomicrobium sp. JCM 19038]GAK10033.1 hypothetical protein JCM19038_3912 [Geomicrobium sp. JCM 19038]